MYLFQVDHAPFVEFVQKYFVDMKPTWDAEDSQIFKPKVDNSIAQYTGGIEQVIVVQIVGANRWRFGKRFLILNLKR